MKLGALALAVLFVLPAFAFLPNAAATEGDLISQPGNPCAVDGHAGGVAVWKAGKRLYYTSRDAPKIYNASTIAPHTPCSVITTATSATGWSHLAFAGTAGATRFWAASGAKVYGLSATGAVLATSPAFPASIQALEVDDVTGQLLIALSDTHVVKRYSTSFALLQTLGATASAGIAAWEGGFLASDGGSYVRLYAPDGSHASFGFRPGYDWQDEFFQPHRGTYGHTETALDDSTFALTGKNTLYLMQEGSITVCVANCPLTPVYECVKWEGPDCLERKCILNCTPPPIPPTYETRYAPHLLAVGHGRPCSRGEVWKPCLPDPCLGIAQPAASFARPTPGLHVRGAQHAASANIIHVGGPLVVEAKDLTGTAAIVSLTHPGGTTQVSGATLVATLDTTSWTRGWNTLRATTRSTLDCKWDNATISVWIEKPTIVTRAQNVRIEGNIPVNAALGTIGIQPADTLLGHESYAAADRTLPGVHLEALGADAANSIDATYLRADASTRVAFADGRIDLQQLCLDLTSSTACPLLPPALALARADAYQSYAHVDVAYRQGSWTRYGGTTGVTAVANANAASQSSAAAAQAQDGQARAVFSIAGRNGVTPPIATGLGTTFAAGPFTAIFDEVVVRQTALAAEVTATVLRIIVDDGAVKGEVVIGESYAAITLGSLTLLEGQPDLIATQDDYDTAADAPNAPASGPALVTGAYSGLLLGADREDGFRVNAQPGQKLRVGVAQAHRVAALANPAPTAPSPEVGPRLMRLSLYDPLGVLRDDSILAADANPAVVELNVDVIGDWRLHVQRIDDNDERAPYTLAVETSLAPLLPDEGAGATCASAAALPATGVATGTAGGGAGDTWRFTVTSPRSHNFTLVPTELEGADLDIEVLNSACTRVAFVHTNAAVKGVAETLTKSFAPGTFYVRVLRVNGLGSYALAVA